MASSLSTREDRAPPQWTAGASRKNASTSWEYGSHRRPTNHVLRGLRAFAWERTIPPPHPPSVGSSGEAGDRSNPAWGRDQIMSSLSSCSPSRIPPRVTKHVQYRSNLSSLVLYWSPVQLILYERMSDMIQAMYQHKISVGTLIKMVKRAHEAILRIRKRLGLHYSHRRSCMWMRQAYVSMKPTPRYLSHPLLRICTWFPTFSGKDSYGWDCHSSSLSGNDDACMGFILSTRKQHMRFVIPITFGS